MKSIDKALRWLCYWLDVFAKRIENADNWLYEFWGRHQVLISIILVVIYIVLWKLY